MSMEIFCLEALAIVDSLDFKEILKKYEEKIYLEKRNLFTN